jgi:hypothetical protein
MQRVFYFLRTNLIFIIPALIIGLIAYVNFAPATPEKPCLSSKYIVAEITNHGQLVSGGKVTLKYRYVYEYKEKTESITRHYSSLPPQNFDRFYVMVCMKDSSDISFNMVTDSIPVKEQHVLGAEYPADSIQLK